MVFCYFLIREGERGEGLLLIIAVTGSSYFAFDGRKLGFVTKIM